MKNLLLFTLILASKLLNACGYYPCGEDTRVSLFKPSVFGYSTYANFHYSAHWFESNDESPLPEFDLPNLRLWFEYCRGHVDLPSIEYAVYQLSEFDIHAHTQNEMIRYLYQQKDTEAINYLRFAKNCEFFNSWQEDPWERNTYLSMPKRRVLMNKALESSKKVQNKALKKRYTFLAIRLAWYNHQFDSIPSLFSSVFEKTKQKDILYYWSLYFKSTTEKDSARANFELAQVFAHAADKRFVCHQHYHSQVAIERTLRFAKTNAEKANVYLLYGIEKPDKTLPYLQNIYSLNPASDGLSFLLLREINKIEDYVLTPYYTLFQPSLIGDYWEDNEFNSTAQTLKRSERDRLYAKEVLQFINSIDQGKVDNPIVWQSCKAYLLFITRAYRSCFSWINKVEKSSSDSSLLNQLKIIRALATTAYQTKGNAIISPKIQSTIFGNRTNSQFIFALGKELEYLGNSTDAALLYATLDDSWTEGAPVFWKTSKNRKHPSGDYFENYFTYVDAVYTPEQLNHLIINIQKHKDKQDPFSKFKYEAVKDEIPRLYDLLGTKYIRQNKLEQALAAFGKINKGYMSRAYTGWGDNNMLFAENPFYNLEYTPRFIPQKEPIQLTKYTITKQLIAYLKKAENKNERNRDYYYFLVANAYYNMGHAGNVSMMRRINGWSSYYLSVIEDEKEFRQSNLAKKYYLLAKQHAKTEKFKALCLRMVVRCEKNKLLYKYAEDYSYAGDYDSLLARNRYYKELQLKYPEHFNDLVSNCNQFEAYFEARR